MVRGDSALQLLTYIINLYQIAVFVEIITLPTLPPAAPVGTVGSYASENRRPSRGPEALSDNAATQGINQ